MNPHRSIADIHGPHLRSPEAARGVCVLLLAALAPLVSAQAPTQPAAAPPNVQITVRPTQPQAQMIPVAVNQGALVDFSVPVREVHVANPGIADVTATAPRQILVTGKSFGTTQLMVLVDGGQQQTFTIAVDLDFERLEASIRTLVPRAQVKVSALLDAIVLSGTVPDAESAERIVQIANIYSPQVINQMRVAGVYQVVLRCTVAEVNRSATRSLGFNGWMAGDNFKDMFAVSNLAGINPVDISAANGYSVSTPIPFGTAQMGLSATPTLSLGFPRVQMQVFIQALRENGLLRILAEPNLVTVSGQEASFLAGGEFPIPVPQGGTNNAITIEFRDFGVRLRFTPTVLSEDTIRLHVAPEVSEPDYSTAITIGGYVVPGLTQRRVDTVVELGPGQTFAIGGLLSEKVRATASKVPALGDMPILGALFSSVHYQSAETELVVLVTPELVAPLNPDQVTRVPGAEYITPNDWELFGLGRLEGEGRPGRAGEPNGKAHSPAQPGSAGASPARVGPPTALRLRGPVGPAGGDEGT
jgi:pilus assembly protein CpaC